MTSTYRQLNRQWVAEKESANPDPALLEELSIAMREVAAISAAYAASMDQSFQDDPTGQDYEGAAA